MSRQHHLRIPTAYWLLHASVTTPLAVAAAVVYAVHGDVWRTVGWAVVAGLAAVNVFIWRRVAQAGAPE